MLIYSSEREDLVVLKIFFKFFLWERGEIKISFVFRFFVLC